MLPSERPKGNPKVVSDTQGEEITPDNPEVVKNFPVDTTDPKAVEEAEEGTDNVVENPGGVEVENPANAPLETPGR